MGERVGDREDHAGYRGLGHPSDPAEHGEDVVLTRHGRAVVRLIPIVERPSAADRRALLEAIRAEGRTKATPGPPAERSQDFLYDSDGLPG